MGLLRKIWPCAKEGIIVSGIMCSGDVLCQTVVEHQKIAEIDLIRTARFGSIGLFFIGPSLHFWYRKLDKLVSHNQTNLLRGLKKMTIDQAFAAPTYMLTVTGLTSAMKGENFAEIKQHLSNEFLEMLKKNYMIWPFVMAFNFSVVPITFQVIFAQTIAIFWNGYISYLLNRNKQVQESQNYLKK